MRPLFFKSTYLLKLKVSLWLQFAFFRAIMLTVNTKAPSPIALFIFNVDNYFHEKVNNNYWCLRVILLCNYLCELGDPFFSGSPS